MNYRLLATLLILTLFETVHAQQGLVLQVDAGFRNQLLTDSQVGYALDPSRQSIADMLRTETVFRPYRQPVVVFGGYGEPMWLRWRLWVKQSASGNYILDVSYVGLDRAQVYLQDSLHRIKALLTVDRKQFLPNRPIPDNRLLFKLNIRPNQFYTIYVRVPRRYERHIVSLHVWDEQAFWADTLIDRSVFFLLIGGLLLAVVVGVFLFSILHERVYWQYSLYVFSLCVVILVMAGYIDPYLLACPFLQFDHTTALAVFFSVGCHVALSNTYLAASRFLPRLYWIGKAISSCSYACIVPFFLPIPSLHALLVPAAYQVLIIAELYILLVVLLGLRQRYIPALIYFIRFLPFIVYLPFLFNLQLLQYIYQSVDLLLVASVFEVMFLGAGIGFSYYETRKARLVLAEQLYQTQEQVIQAQESERQRIAADLHDELGGTLATIKGQLETIKQSDGKVESPIRLMEKAIRDLRHISHNLMPPEFAKLGLTEAIRETVRQVEVGSDLYFLFITYGEERRFDNETELMIYRIAIELLNNALKHAQAHQITVQLIFYPKQVSLLVEDDGRGYPVVEQTNQPGIGLRNIRSRVAWLKSTLLVDSGERGTTITLEVPL